MSDKLTLSATISVLLMTAYALFGNESARLPIGADHLDAPAQVASVSLPALNAVLAKAGSRHILY